MKPIMVDLSEYVASSRDLTDREINTLSSWVGAQGYKPDLWQWQFTSSVGDCTHLILEDDQGLVAFNGLMPRRALISGQEIDFIWSCDFIVCPNSRGKGVGRKMKAELLGQYSGSVIASLGISASARTLLSKMGWESCSGLTEYRKIRRCNNIKDISKNLMQALNYCYGFINNGSVAIDKSNISLAACLPSKDEVDGFWSQVAESFSASVVRDYEYLNWRYQHHPLASQCYRYLVSRDNSGRLDAILVVRPQSNVLHIVDYLGPSESLDLKRLLLKSAEKHFKDCETLSLCIVQKEWIKAALCQGYYKTQSSLSFSIRYPNKNSKDVRWFLMKGDSDGEFLEAAKYAAGVNSHD